MATHSLAITGSCPSFNCSYASELQSNPDISGIGVRPRLFFRMPCASFADNYSHHVRSYWDSQSRITSHSSSALPTTISTSIKLQIQLIGYSWRRFLRDLFGKHPRNGVKLFRALYLHSVIHRLLPEFLSS